MEPPTFAQNDINRNTPMPEKVTNDLWYSKLTPYLEMPTFNAP